ncbi:MAG: zinc-dependent metalloprotease [Chitinophagaceae bacterium]|nr:zinc-dependent metalloprotease [Chitinophagaceae bacterium]
MKAKFILLLATAICFTISAYTQSICGFDHIHKKLSETNPSYRKKIAEQNQQLDQYIQKNKSRLTARTNGTLAALYTIPVVVHVIHTGSAIGTIYNPTDAQIVGAINYLNQVYNGTYPGITGAGDLQIQFVLAQRDPNCNPTNGINRVNGSGILNYAANGVNLSGSSGTNELNVKNLIRWDPSQYYNIWVVNKIDGSDGTYGSFTAGYAYFPGASPSLDGTVMLATQMVAGEKTLPHEIGHALNLYHPFEGAIGSTCPSNSNCNTQGDRICDTDPITQPAFVTRTGTNPCTGTNYNDNTEKNFMNYTDQYILFTPGQKARLLAAMTLPSRSSLASSLGGTPPSAGGTTCVPKINFEFTEGYVTEATSFTSGCRSYTDYNYNMVIGNSPSATATVTLNVAGGTATEGVDFDITTNGNFSTPSKVLTFPAGTNASRSFTMRVYNDASVEPSETLTLGFTVNSGGGNAVAGDGRPNFTMTFLDNDAAPSAGTATGTANIGTAAFFINGPFDASQQKKRTQFLYRASELTSAGVPAGELSGISLNLQKLSTRAYTNLSIKIGTAAVADMVDGSATVATTSTVKTLASYSTVDGWNDFTFDVPFNWNGTSNVVVEICYDNGTSTTDAVDPVLAYSDGGNASQGNLITQDGKNCSESFSSPLGTYFNGRKPVIRFSYGIPATSIQSIVNSTRSEYLGPNADIYFYDQSQNKLLARVRNLSNHDYGCTQLLIDRAGTGANQFWSNTTSQYLMSKSFRVVPTTNNTSGQYEITLYYTQAEVQGWEAATGQTWNNIQLVKVPSQISNYSPSNPVPDGANAVQIVTPTRGTFGSNYTLTYTFNSGFSGFGAGNPGIILPVTLLSFEGRMDNNTALLQWKTGVEISTKNFEIEKSVDGINFYKIGEVNASGNSTALHTYEFRDLQIGLNNYYRLRMNGQDGSASLSDIVIVRNTGTVQSLKVLNNPFNHYIDLRLANKAERIIVELININGIVIKKQQFSDVGSLRWSLSGNIPKGAYIFRVTADNKIFTHKVVKQ